MRVPRRAALRRALARRRPPALRAVGKILARLARSPAPLREGRRRRLLRARDSRRAAMGGVLEHPEGSHAWRAHGLLPPTHRGGWEVAADGLGWTCCVEQGIYGHPAPKKTWLYAVGVPDLPSLRWGPSGAKQRVGVHRYPTAAERAAAKASGAHAARLLKICSHRDRSLTPRAFMAVLVAMAEQIEAGRLDKVRGNTGELT